MTDNHTEFVKFKSKKEVTSEDKELLILFNMFFDKNINSASVFTQKQEDKLKDKLKSYSPLDFTFTDEVNYVQGKKATTLFELEPIDFADLPSDDFYKKSYFHKILPANVRVETYTSDFF